MNKQSIIKIAETYGFDTQSRQCIEEMAELTVALNKYHRERDKWSSFLKECFNDNTSLENVKEEIADVYIMLEQMKYLLNISETDIENIINRKLERQLERISNELG